MVKALDRGAKESRESGLAVMRRVAERCNHILGNNLSSFIGRRILVTGTTQ